MVVYCVLCGLGGGVVCGVFRCAARRTFWVWGAARRVGLAESKKHGHLAERARPRIPTSKLAFLYTVITEYDT